MRWTEWSDRHANRKRNVSHTECQKFRGEWKYSFPWTKRRQATHLFCWRLLPCWWQLTSKIMVKKTQLKCGYFCMFLAIRKWKQIAELHPHLNLYEIEMKRQKNSDFEMSNHLHAVPALNICSSSIAEPSTSCKWKILVQSKRVMNVNSGFVLCKLHTSPAGVYIGVAFCVSSLRFSFFTLAAGHPPPKEICVISCVRCLENVVVSRVVNRTWQTNVKNHPLSQKQVSFSWVPFMAPVSSGRWYEDVISRGDTSREGKVGIGNSKRILE